jgi:diguanylate cyclase (GGDEF)-like protein
MPIQAEKFPDPGAERAIQPALAAPARLYSAFARRLFASGAAVSLLEGMLTIDWFLTVPWWIQVTRSLLMAVLLAYPVLMPRFDPNAGLAIPVGLIVLCLVQITVSRAAVPVNAVVFSIVVLVGVVALVRRAGELVAVVAVGAATMWPSVVDLDTGTGWVPFSTLLVFASAIGSAVIQYRRRLTEANAALHRLSTIDSLTKLKNRRAYDEAVAGEFERYRRYGTPFSVLLLDIDFFKRVNDTYGHDSGDVVLARVGREIESAIRTSELAFRLGGEEFAVLTTNSGAQAACHAAERLRSGVENLKIGVPGVASCISVTLSVGVASVSAGSTAASLYRTADQALYRAKSGGRNRVGAAADSAVRSHVSVCGEPDGSPAFRAAPVE